MMVCLVEIKICLGHASEPQPLDGYPDGVVLQAVRNTEILNLHCTFLIFPSLSFFFFLEKAEVAWKWPLT